MTLALLFTAALAGSSNGPPPLLALPIACRPGIDCEVQNLVDRDPGAGARDYQCGTLTYDGHTGVDIRLPDLAARRRGVAVLAAADGQVLRVRDGVRDISVRQAGPEAVKGQECGNGLVIAHAGGLSTQYCHMAQGSLAVKSGQTVKAGQALGLVGLSGNTEYPHLHFTVRRNEAVVDPFAQDAPLPGGCSSGAGLWRADVAARLPYKAGAVLNVGFTDGPIEMARIEEGNIPSPNTGAAALVAYVRVIGLKIGDRQEIVLSAPDGRVLAESKEKPLPRAQAQRLLYVGKPRPANGWAKGHYQAFYRIIRDGKVIIERRWSLAL